MPVHSCSLYCQWTRCLCPSMLPVRIGVQLDYNYIQRKLIVYLWNLSVRIIRFLIWTVKLHHVYFGFSLSTKFLICSTQVSGMRWSVQRCHLPTGKKEFLPARRAMNHVINLCNAPYRIHHVELLCASSNWIQRLTLIYIVLVYDVCSSIFSCNMRNTNLYAYHCLAEIQFEWNNGQFHTLLPWIVYSRILSPT